MQVIRSRGESTMRSGFAVSSSALELNHLASTAVYRHPASSGHGITDCLAERHDAVGICLAIHRASQNQRRLHIVQAACKDHETSLRSRLQPYSSSSIRPIFVLPARIELMLARTIFGL